MDDKSYIITNVNFSGGDLNPVCLPVTDTEPTSLYMNGFSLVSATAFMI